MNAPWVDERPPVFWLRSPPRVDRAGDDSGDRPRRFDVVGEFRRPCSRGRAAGRALRRIARGGRRVRRARVQEHRRRDDGRFQLCVGGGAVCGVHATADRAPLSAVGAEAAGAHRSGCGRIDGPGREYFAHGEGFAVLWGACSEELPSPGSPTSRARRGSSVDAIRWSQASSLARPTAPARVAPRRSRRRRSRTSFPRASVRPRSRPCSPRSAARGGPRRARADARASRAPSAAPARRGPPGPPGRRRPRRPRRR